MPTLVIDGFVDDYDPGSLPLRVVELGFNHVAVTVRIRLRDKQSGRIIGGREHHRRGQSGHRHDKWPRSTASGETHPRVRERRIWRVADCASSGPASRACRLRCVADAHARSGQHKAYTPKNGVLNWKAMILGGGFRVTVAVPLHGDFSKYDRLEIVRSESLIGPDVPAGVSRPTDGSTSVGIQRRAALRRRRRRRFVRRQPAARRRQAPAPERRFAAPTAWTRRCATPATFSPSTASGRRPQRSHPASATLVVRSQVIDYAKGNKFLQLLFLDLGNGVLTMRFSYLDKVTGRRARAQRHFQRQLVEGRSQRC